MERFLFKKVEFWVVGLLVVFLLAMTLLFGAMVHDRVQGGRTFGIFGRLAAKVAASPSEAIHATKMILAGNVAGMATEHSNRFDGRGGWRFLDARIASGLDGYLLFSRYDGDAGHHVFELVDLKAGEVMHRVDVDATKLLEGAREDLIFADVRNYNNSRFQAIHPIATDNGDLIVKGFFTPLFRMTPCGERVWLMDDFITHHTTERGPDGNLWTSSYVEPPQVEGLSRFFQDPGLVQISPDGEVLYHESFTEILIRNGFGPLILSLREFDTDPLHLNDVQPVMEDGPYWKRGDLFLSVRHLSAIFQYRPSTGEIVWWKTGPWASQHDVDIINDTTIGVFDNRAYNFGSGYFVDGNSQVVFYDFSTDTVSEPFQKSLIEQDFRNEAAGLFTVLPDGHYYVDESESGRSMIFTPDGELAVENINRAENGLIYHLGWSRYMNREDGDRLLSQWQSAPCNEDTNG